MKKRTEWMEKDWCGALSKKIGLEEYHRCSHCCCSGCCCRWFPIGKKTAWTSSTDSSSDFRLRCHRSKCDHHKTCSTTPLLLLPMAIETTLSGSLPEFRPPPRAVVALAFCHATGGCPSSTYQREGFCRRCFFSRKNTAFVAGRIPPAAGTLPPMAAMAAAAVALFSNFTNLFSKTHFRTL